MQMAAPIYSVMVQPSEWVYPEENVVRGENVPNFKVNTSEGT